MTLPNRRAMTDFGVVKRLWRLLAVDMMAVYMASPAASRENIASTKSFHSLRAASMSRGPRRSSPRLIVFSLCTSVLLPECRLDITGSAISGASCSSFFSSSSSSPFSSPFSSFSSFSPFFSLGPPGLRSSNLGSLSFNLLADGFMAEAADSESEGAPLFPLSFGWPSGKSSFKVGRLPPCWLKKAVYIKGGRGGDPCREALGDHCPTGP
mmetsp:Transcript_60752/g.131741  ORF Transcript_60752/g.131741 Transcript_60752/m.131741 type:complete len:210 (-) Transcript_60752:7-636(-)